MKLPPNERDTTQDKMIITNVVEAVKAIISPLQDKMKRTKKQKKIFLVAFVFQTVILRNIC